MSYDELQSEHKEWLSRMYPGQPAMIPAAGVIEETGELLHAILKLEQFRLWGKEPRYTPEELHAKLIDAIGDCGIYVCSLCNARKWDFDILVTSSFAYFDEGDALAMAVSLVSDAAKVPSMLWRDASRYMSMLKTLTYKLKLDFYACIMQTWEEVKERRREPEAGQGAEAP